MQEPKGTTPPNYYTVWKGDECLYRLPAKAAVGVSVIGVFILGLVGAQFSSYPVTQISGRTFGELSDFTDEFRARAFWIIAATTFWIVLLAVPRWSKGITRMSLEEAANDSVRSRWNRCTRWAVVVVVVVVTSTYVFSNYNIWFTYPLPLCELCVLESGVLFSVPIIVGLMWYAGGYCCVLLVSAVSSTLYQITSGEQMTVEQLRTTFGRTRTVLYLAGVLLGSAVLEIFALYNWVAEVLPKEEDRHAFGELARAIAAGWGLLFTLFLAATYIPVLVVQVHAARMMGDQAKPDLSWTKRRKWLKKSGLRLTFGQEVKGLTAVIWPALAGGPITALVSLFI